MPKVVETVEQNPEEYSYFVQNLGAVLTPREVQIMWGISQSPVVYWIEKGVIRYRRSVSGGALLLHRPSVVEALGEPVNDLVTRLYLPEHIKFERKR